MAVETNRRASLGGITFNNPVAFWLGMVAVTVGVILHLPMYLGAQDMGYRLAGTDAGAEMFLGMALILLGFASTAYGLFPRLSEVSRGYVSRIRVRALDDAPIKPAHIGLLLVLAAAVTIDVMKPTTLAFVVPGMAAEYGLKSPLNPAGSIPVALLPLAGITGTVIG
nr:hypothetical protein [Actinomycetota bacterium]